MVSKPIAVIKLAHHDQLVRRSIRCLVSDG
jgi:hypothetical protein